MKKKLILTAFAFVSLNSYQVKLLTRESIERDYHKIVRNTSVQKIAKPAFLGLAGAILAYSTIKFLGYDINLSKVLEFKNPLTPVATGAALAAAIAANQQVAAATEDKQTFANRAKVALEKGAAGAIHFLPGFVVQVLSQPLSNYFYEKIFLEPDHDWFYSKTDYRKNVKNIKYALDVLSKIVVGDQFEEGEISLVEQYKLLAMENANQFVDNVSLFLAMLGYKHRNNSEHLSEVFDRIYRLTNEFANCVNSLSTKNNFEAAKGRALGLLNLISKTIELCRHIEVQ